VSLSEGRRSGKRPLCDGRSGPVRPAQPAASGPPLKNGRRSGGQW
jgi:hypothetical protein